MTRVNLCLAGLQVLSLVAIGWLWSENRSLRTHGDGGSDMERETARNSPTHEERLSAQRAVGSSPQLGARNRNPGTPRSNSRVNGPEAGTRGGAQVAQQDQLPVESIGSSEQTMPADGPSVPETRLIVATQPAAGSLIVNGGFDGGLAPWICEGGRVIRDPADEKNWLLEVTETERRFSLKQIFFKPPARKAPMTLSFLALTSEEAAVSGFHLILAGHGDKALAQTFVEAGKPGEWKKIEWKGSVPMAPALLSIRRHGKGVVWIDDVRLEQSTAEPAQAQAP